MKPLENQKITVREKPMVEQGIVFTPEMLKELIATVMQQSNAQTLEAIKELKKLPAHEQEALDKKLERERQARVNRVKEAIQDERLRKTQQFYCNHIKHAEGVYKQEHAFRGQVNNDNCCRAQCIRCNKLFPPFKVTEENMKSGMALQNLKGLTAEALYQAHIKSFPDCQECAKGACAHGDLRQLKNQKLDPVPTVLPDGKVLAEQLTA